MADNSVTLDEIKQIMRPGAQPTMTAPAVTLDELKNIGLPQRAMPPSPYRTQGLGGPGINPEQLMSTAGRFLQGVGRGASMGLTDFPAAAALMATRSMTGGAPMSFPDALREVKLQQQQASQAGPAYTVGSLTGGLATGGALGIGKTLLGTTARGATMGAISGALPETPSEFISPVGAAIGTIAGAAGGALTGGLSAAGARAEPLVRGQYLANQQEAVARYTTLALKQDPNLIQKARDQLIANARNDMRIGPKRPAAEALAELRTKIDEIATLTDDQILTRIGTPKSPGIPGLKINSDVFNNIRIRNQRIEQIDAIPQKTTEELFKSLKGEAKREVSRAREVTTAALPGMALGSLAGTTMALMQGQPQNIPAYAMMMAGAGGAYGAREALGQAARDVGIATLARFPGLANIPAGTSAALTGGLASMANLPPYDYRMLLGQ